MRRLRPKGESPVLRVTWLERDSVQAELDNCTLRVYCSDVGVARRDYIS